MTVVNETLLAGGGEGQLMTVRHLVLSGAHEEIGAALARLWRDRHEGTVEADADPLMARAQREWTTAHWPQNRARGRGAARELGLDPSDDRYDFSMLSYGFSPPPMCSCVYYPPALTESGHGILARNYDFTTGTFADVWGAPHEEGAEAATAQPYLLEVHPDEGFSTLMMCAYDLTGAGIDGVNSEGLSVALLADAELMAPGALEPMMTNGVGLYELAVPRFLLETCANVEEAKLALLKSPQYYNGIPCHYLVGDAEGRCFVWEFSKHRNRPYIHDGDGSPLCITNHQLLPHEPPAIPAIEETQGRLEALRDAIGAKSPPFTLGALRASQEAVANRTPAGTGLYAGAVPVRTLWTALWDTLEHSVEIDFYLSEQDDQIARTAPAVIRLSRPEAARRLLGDAAG